MGTAVFAEASGNTLKGNLLAFLGLLAALLVALAVSYPLFHSLVELATVVIAMAAGVVGWHTFPFSRNHFLLYLAAGYFWVGIVDLFHVLSYSGVSVIDADGGNRATQFWLVGRYLEAGILFAAPFFLTRSPSRRGSFFAVGAITLLLCGVILLGRFPVAFEPETGLTPFKVYSEYLIIALLGVALGHLALRRSALDPQVWGLLAFAIAMTVLSEFAFTLYSDVYGLENLLGHLGKLVSYWAIFYAIVHLTLTEPFRWMARGAQSFDAVPDVTLILDRDGIIRHSNPAALQFAQVAEDECLGRHCHELFHPRDLAPGACPVCQALAEGVEEDTRIELHFPERQQWRQISLAPVRTPTGTQGVIHIGRNITQRRAAEDALAIRHDELDSILTSVGEGVLGMDTEGRATYVNAAFERLTGWTEAEFIGRNGHDTLHHTRADGTPFPREECPVHRTVVEGRIHHQAEDLFWRQDGSAFPVEYTSAAVRDRNGAVTGAVVVFRDITERKALERERHEHREELERKVAARTAELQAANRELESFSYSVSHDLRAPLRTIDGFSDALCEDYRDALDEEGRRYLERMRGAARRMGEQLDGLLALSRVTRRELEMEAVDLSAIATGIAEELETAEPNRQVEWRIEPGLQARGDSALLHVLLQNLLGNAWKFTGRRETARIEFGAEETDQGRAFYVRDNGSGFAMESAGELFRPFQRLHSQDEYEGTGIGLATVYRVIERHGGRVWAEAAPDQGASFHFTLPEAAQPAAPVSGPGTASAD